MNTKWITCSMCGTRFDPEDQVACAACPIQAGCQLVRCPACGFEAVNVEKSGLAKLAMRLFAKPRRDSPEFHHPVDKRFGEPKRYGDR